MECVNSLLHSQYEPDEVVCKSLSLLVTDNIERRAAFNMKPNLYIANNMLGIKRRVFVRPALPLCVIEHVLMYVNVDFMSHLESRGWYNHEVYERWIARVLGYERLAVHLNFPFRIVEILSESIVFMIGFDLIKQYDIVFKCSTVRPTYDGVCARFIYYYTCHVISVISEDDDFHRFHNGPIYFHDDDECWTETTIAVLYSAIACLQYYGSYNKRTMLDMCAYVDQMKNFDCSNFREAEKHVFLKHYDGSFHSRRRLVDLETVSECGYICDDEGEYGRHDTYGNDLDPFDEILGLINPDMISVFILFFILLLCISIFSVLFLCFQTLSSIGGRLVSLGHVESNDLIFYLVISFYAFILFLYALYHGSLFSKCVKAESLEVSYVAVGFLLIDNDLIYINFVGYVNAMFKWCLGRRMAIGVAGPIFEEVVKHSLPLSFTFTLVCYEFLNCFRVHGLWRSILGRLPGTFMHISLWFLNPYLAMPLHMLFNVYVKREEFIGMLSVGPVLQGVSDVIVLLENGNRLLYSKTIRDYHTNAVNFFRSLHCIGMDDKIAELSTELLKLVTGTFHVPMATSKEVSFRGFYDRITDVSNWQQYSVFRQFKQLFFGSTLSILFASSMLPYGPEVMQRAYSFIKAEKIEFTNLISDTIEFIRTCGKCLNYIIFGDASVLVDKSSAIEEVLMEANILLKHPNYVNGVEDCYEWYMAAAVVVGKLNNLCKMIKQGSQEYSFAFKCRFDLASAMQGIEIERLRPTFNGRSAFILIGPPMIGKTTLVKSIHKFIRIHFNQKVEDTLFRYQASLRFQKWLPGANTFFMDDIGVINKDFTMEDNEWAKLMLLGTGVPIIIDAAEIEKKGEQVFCGDLIAMTTNMDMRQLERIMSAFVSDTGAVKRRMGFNISIDLKPGHKGPTGPINVPADPFSMWTFCVERYNIVTKMNDVIKADATFSDVMRFIIIDMKRIKADTVMITELYDKSHCCPDCFKVYQGNHDDCEIRGALNIVNAVIEIGSKSSEYEDEFCIFITPILTYVFWLWLLFKLKSLLSAYDRSFFGMCWHYAMFYYYYLCRFGIRGYWRSCVIFPSIEKYLEITVYDPLYRTKLEYVERVTKFYNENFEKILKFLGVCSGLITVYGVKTLLDKFNDKYGYDEHHYEPMGGVLSSTNGPDFKRPVVIKKDNVEVIDYKHKSMTYESMRQGVMDRLFLLRYIRADGRPSGCIGFSYSPKSIITVAHDFIDNHSYSITVKKKNVKIAIPIMRVNSCELGGLNILRKDDIASLNFEGGNPLKSAYGEQFSMINYPPYGRYNACVIGLDAEGENTYKTGYVDFIVDKGSSYCAMGVKYVHGPLFKSVNMFVEQGDCGSILLIQIGVKWCIAGMNICGIEGKESCYKPLLRQNFKSAFLMGIEPRYDASVEAKVYDSYTMAGLDPRSIYNKLGDRQLPGLVLGTLEPNDFASNDKIVMFKTLCADYVYKHVPGLPEWYPATSKERIIPAYDFKVNFMSNAIIVKCGNQPMLDPAIAAKVVTLMNQIVDRDLPEKAPILSVHDAIRGIPGDPCIRALDKNTAIGGLTRTGTKKKYVVMLDNEDDKDDFTFTDEILEEICDLKQDLEARIYVPLIYKAQLKCNEVLKAAKAGRLISVFSTTSNVIMRVYWLRVCKYIQEKMSRYGCCVGVNCFGKDWERILRMQMGDNKNHLSYACDIAHFDLSIYYQICLYVCLVLINIMKKFGYEESEEFAAISCLYSFLHAIVIYKADAAMIFGNNPSGIPITTILNCLVIYFIFIYVYIKTIPCDDIDEIKRNMVVNTYGDDNLPSFAPHLLDKFTFEYLKKEIAKIGFTITPDDKDAETCEPDSLLNRGTFLKRGFKVLKLRTIKFVACPRDLDSIYKSLIWYEPSKSISILEQQRLIVEDALKEFLMYGEDYYNNRREFLYGCLAEIGIQGHLKTFDEACDAFERGDFGTFNS